MEKNQTADHIFTLKSIINSYKSKKKKVFACFIDLKKAFDTVWKFRKISFIKNKVKKSKDPILRESL
jgi:hypothetical protein